MGPSFSGYCLELGSPGSWEGSGGKVVELMSASLWAWSSAHFCEKLISLGMMCSLP